MLKFIAAVWLFLFSVTGSAQSLSLPCWQHSDCYTEQRPEINLNEFIKKRPQWHRELDDLNFDFKPNKDYSIFWNSQKDRQPAIHTPESQRAVDELAGEVFSSISSPFAYKISVYSEIEKKKNEINAKLYSAIPEFKSNTYSIGFKPHVDFSFSNPVSLEARIGNGRNLGSIFFSHSRNRSVFAAS